VPRKLKHNPTRRELRLTAHVSEEALHKHFGGLKGALEKAGVRPSGSGFRQQESTVLLDWAAVARKLGKIPTVTEYESRGRFSDMPFHTRLTLQLKPHASQNTHVISRLLLQYSPCREW
jgi:hypothetical protein